MKEAWIELRERPVRYLEIGGGAPVIFAAGLGISADFYQPNMRALAAAGFRAIAPDLPGFGRTRGPALGNNVSQLTQHLIEVTRALGVRHAGWIGHSLGCQPLLQVAAQQPQLVRAMVLAGPTGGYGHRLTHQTVALASAAINEPWRLMRAVIRDYLRLSPFNYLGTWIKARHDDPLHSAKRTRAPALLLVGTNDRVPAPEFLHDLAKVLRADIVKLAGGNHGLPLDAQIEFDRACVRFFRSVM